MKIAMFGHKHIPSRDGGVEIVVEALSTRMAALGHNVTCYNRGGNAGNHKGVRIRPVPALKGKGLSAVSSSFFAALCAAFGDYDVVHIHAEGPAGMCWIPKLFGKRVIVTIHGLDWRRAKWQQRFAAKYIHWGEKMAVRWADQIIILSQNMQTYFQHTYRRDTVRIPNGVCCPHTQPPETISRQFGLTADRYILYLGRLVPEKGIHYLIQAFRNTDTDKRLVIAGASGDADAYVEELHRLAVGDARIVFTGFVEGQVLAELYSNAYLYTLPSDLEGMPISLLEAMSYGNCCLVSDIPECTEVIQDHAVTFHSGDWEDLRNRLQTLCDNPALVAGYRKDAQSFVCKHYNWDTTVEKTLELY